MADIIPDASWELDKIAAFIRDGIKQHTKFRDQRASFRDKIRDIGRQTTGNAWRVGKALLVAREQLKAEREWKAWLKDNQLWPKKSTLYNYMDIAKKADDPATIQDKTLTEVRRELGLAGDQPRRIAIPEPTPKTALDAIDKAIDIIEKALMAAKEGDQDRDRLADLMTRLADLAGGPKPSKRREAAKTR